MSIVRQFIDSFKKEKAAKIEAYREAGYQQGYNEAIKKCIEVANKYESYGAAYEMRTLKK